MVFSSSVFLFLFFPAFLAFYFAVPAKFLALRNFVLMVFSLVFYAWGEPVWVFLMVATVFGVWLIGQAMERSKSRAAARSWLILSVVLCLSSLVVFKYSGFIFETINNKVCYNSCDILL